MLLTNFRELKTKRKRGWEREGGVKREEREKRRDSVPHANRRKRATGEATRFHGAHAREDPLTFFQYEAQRDEQALRVGLREGLSSRMQKYLRILVKGSFMHV